MSRSLGGENRLFLLLKAASYPLRLKQIAILYDRIH